MKNGNNSWESKMELSGDVETSRTSLRFYNVLRENKFTGILLLGLFFMTFYLNQSLGLVSAEFANVNIGGMNFLEFTDAFSQASTNPMWYSPYLQALALLGQMLAFSGVVFFAIFMGNSKNRLNCDRLNMNMERLFVFWMISDFISLICDIMLNEEKFNPLYEHLGQFSLMLYVIPLVFVFIGHLFFFLAIHNDNADAGSIKAAAVLLSIGYGLNAVIWFYMSTITNGIIASVIFVCFAVLAKKLCKEFGEDKNDTDEEGESVSEAPAQAEVLPESAE